ncbi:MAG TPA: hypothetical protein VGG72_14915 [Bryobacteraceae bacterium]
MILEMLMQVYVILVLLFFTDDGSALVGSFEVGLPGTFRAHGA